MGPAGTAAVCIAILVVGGGAVYLVSKSTRAPVTAVIQAPSPAVAGIQAIAGMASKGIDAWIASRASKDSDEE